jgi:hypothetical protein
VKGGIADRERSISDTGYPREQRGKSGART